MPFFPPTGEGTPGPVQLFYDVKQFGAVGNGIADDTAAIQSAINASYAANVASANSVYLPQGDYKTTATLQLKGGMRLWGDGFSSRIIGAFNDYVITDSLVGQSWASGYGPQLDNLMIVNSVGGGILCGANKLRTSLINCWIQTKLDGLTQEFNGTSLGGIFGLTLIGNKFQGDLTVGSAAIRIASGGGLVDLNNDCTHWDIGRQYAGIGGNISGGRTEVTRTGFKIGKYPDDTTVALSGFTLDSIECEAMETCIHIVSGVNGTISNMIGGVWGEPGHLGIVPLYGIRIDDGQQLVFSNLNPGGEFTGAAIKINAPSLIASFENVLATNVNANGAVWDVNTLSAGLKFSACNYTPITGVTVPDIEPKAIALSGVAGYNCLTNPGAPKNFSGTVTVGSAATTAAVLFPKAENAALATAFSLSQSAGGSLTALGAYHYRCVVVTETGEVYADLGVGGTLTGSNRTFTVNMGSTAGYTTAYRKRLYRGTGTSTTGTFDGYWDLTLNTNVTSFVDDGTTPFDGEKQGTGVNQSTTVSAAEPDAAYNVLCTPTWDTRVWVTGRATTGFTLNFSSAPGSDTPLKWQLIR